MMTACWFTIACCCWAKTACWSPRGETVSKQDEGMETLFGVFVFYIFTVMSDTNQVLQVPQQRQEATSYLPQEGLSQLWTQAQTSSQLLTDSMSVR